MLSTPFSLDDQYLCPVKLKIICYICVALNKLLHPVGIPYYHYFIGTYMLGFFFWDGACLRFFQQDLY